MWLLLQQMELSVESIDEKSRRFDNIIVISTCCLDSFQFLAMYVVYNVSQKIPAILFGHNFDKCWPIFTARSSCASEVLGIVILSVRPSVTRLLCDESKEHTAEILTPHERVINLFSDTGTKRGWWAISPSP